MRISRVDASGLGGGSLRIDATNGTPRVPFAVMASTNAALPRAQWTRIVTGILDTNGCLDQFVVPVDPRSPCQYFQLQEY